MAEEKKEEAKTLSRVENVNEWVLAYYGDDARDVSKAKKIEHLVRTCQYASIVFIISKNSKMAHTDFFETNYETLDSRYNAAAEFIIKLLKRKAENIKAGKDPVLSAEDYKDCGGVKLFGDSENVIQDYIGAGGMVEMCQQAFPAPSKTDFLRTQPKSYWKGLSDSQINSQFEKWSKDQVIGMYGDMQKDLEKIKLDHSHLLNISGSQDGTLSGETLTKIYEQTTDKAAQMHRELKGKISGLDFDIKKSIEESAKYKYEFGKSSLKVAALGGGAVASMGAVIGGVFWPAFLLIPMFSLAKKWVPNWFESLGKVWGNFEKTMGQKFERQKLKVHHSYIIRYAETGKEPPLSLKDRLFLRKNVRKCLKKGAKSLANISYEGSDEKLYEGLLPRAQRATALVTGKLRNIGDGDKLDIVDKKAHLENSLNKINKDDVTLKDFISLANSYDSWQGSLPSAFKLDFQASYADKLKESAHHLIFGTSMESLTQHGDVIEAAFKDDGKLMGVIKDIPGHGSTQYIQRLKAFAGGELSGLSNEGDDDDKKWKGKTLEEYIKRPGMEWTNISGGISELNKYINGLQRNPNNENEVVYIEGGKIYTLNEISSQIAALDDTAAKNYYNKKLQEKMKVVFYNGFREDAQATYNALLEGEFAGKTSNIQEFYQKLKEMNYSNVDSDEYTKLLYNVTGSTRISPSAAGRYFRGKIGKTAFDVFQIHLNANGDKFEEDLKALTEYLKKLNSCEFLNENQKADLTAGAKANVNSAFDKFIKDMSKDFMGEYNLKTINSFMDSEYSSGGFKTLFRTDSSTEVLNIKNKLNSLARLNGAHKVLAFNGYSMSEVDKYIIGQVLLRDSEDDFDSVKVRESNDKLVNFLSNSLNMSTSYSDLASASIDDIKVVIQRESSPYKEIEKKLDKITKTDMKDCDYFDKYAALIALKNRAVVEFRSCLTRLVQDKCGGNSANIWLQSEEGKSFYRAVITVWQNGVFKDIDDAFNEMQGEALDKLDDKGKEALKAKLTKLGNPTTLNDELKRYDGTYTIDLSTEKGLGA